MVFKIIIGGLCISILQYLKNRFCYRHSKSYGQEAKLSFKTVADIYHVNHKRWKYARILLNDSDGIIGTTKVLLYNAYTCSYDDKIYWSDLGYYDKLDRYGHIRDYIIRVHLSYFDWLKLRFYYLFKRSSTKGTEMMLETAQKDIDKLRTEAQSKIKVANYDIANIMTKINKENEMTGL